MTCMIHASRADLMADALTRGELSKSTRRREFVVSIDKCPHRPEAQRRGRRTEGS